MRVSQKWWEVRRAELLGLERERPLLFVYNEETLNDTLFDLLALDAVEKVFYPVRVNPHPGILDRVHTLDACFKCAALSEVERLLTAFPQLSRARILFVPEDQISGDWEAAAAQGLTVALQPSLVERARPDILGSQETLLWLKEGFRPHAVRKRDSREQKAPKIEMENLAEPMRRLGLSLKGIHVSMDDERQAFRDFEERLLPHLIEIASRFEDGFILSLGNGLGVTPDSDQGGVDIEATATNLDAVKEKCPEAEIWLEPGPRVVAKAGILLARAGKVQQNEEGLFFETDQRPGRFVISKAAGIPHEVVHLFEEDGRGKGRGEGEILVVTNMGAHGARALHGSPISDFVPEHYLKARSICPVKI